ncbi:SIR2 family protein [Pseudomonas lurida]|uniref:SIR2 family protein n=1 Tax=Pseudomonas lurida TaxID=244566 RepID=UPI003D2D87A5
MKSFSHGIEELRRVLDLGRQHWLLGAGASLVSGIPLMYPLTTRVKSQLQDSDLEIFSATMSDLPDDAHVEHTLSHLGDLIALAERSKSKTAHLAGKDIDLQQLEATYRTIIKVIAETVRYGYRSAYNADPEQIGTYENPIVDVDPHVKFVRQVFGGRINLEPRSQVGFITTNYDTLLEDALAIERRVALDGFSGGAIAYWDGESIDPSTSTGYREHRVLKLHGSVDWFKNPEVGLLRVRYGVKYLADLAGTLIYPQATKYLETQKDPFAKIFDCFRRVLQSPESHLLAIVGYSFGDNHINAEIEHALATKSNKTVVVVFSRENPIEGGTEVCATLKQWLENKDFGSRIYVATNKALYHGSSRYVQEPVGDDLKWWTFDGVTNFLESGALT